MAKLPCKQSIDWAKQITKRRVSHNVTNSHLNWVRVCCLSEIEDDRVLSPEELQFNKKLMDMLSECCSLLLEEYANIYEMKKEDMKRLVIVQFKFKFKM